MKIETKSFLKEIVTSVYGETLYNALDYLSFRPWAIYYNHNLGISLLTRYKKTKAKQKQDENVFAVVSVAASKCIFHACSRP